MREIVVHRDAARRANQILTAPDAFEARERGPQIFQLGAVALCACGQRGHGVAQVVVARHRQEVATGEHATGKQIEGRARFRKSRWRCQPVRWFAAGVVTFQRVPSDVRRIAQRLVDDLTHQRIRRVRDHEPALRQFSEQLDERFEVAVERRINVDVIVLDRRQDHDVSAVVQKLRGLFEERGVVLVAFDHERRATQRLCRPSASAVRARAAELGNRARKFLGKAADQESGTQAGALQSTRRRATWSSFCREYPRRPMVTRLRARSDRSAPAMCVPVVQKLSRSFRRTRCRTRRLRSRTAGDAKACRPSASAVRARAAELGTARKIFGQAADQESGTQAGALQ